MKNPFLVAPGSKVKLSSIDASDASLLPGGKEEAEKERKKLRDRMESQQELLWAEHEQRILIILQGMDTSGKDGTIRMLMDGFDAAGVRVESFKKPTQPELEHDFLWRVHARVPGDGELVIFNRSHYEDVLVVRVHNLVPEKVWRPRYQQIKDFERMLSDSGTTILKFFLHISKEEQRERLQARLDEPDKRWKFNPGDLAERKLWDQYQRAYEEALEKTSTKHAPWHIIPADRKWFRNWMVASVVVEAMEGLEMRYPEPADLEGVVVD